MVERRDVGSELCSYIILVSDSGSVENISDPEKLSGSFGSGSPQETQQSALCGEGE